MIDPVDAAQRTFAPRAQLADPRGGSRVSGLRDCITIDRMVQEGSVITLPDMPLQRHLVGYFEWVGDNAAFVFPAFGERNTDGRLVSFTDIVMAPPGACFVNDTLIAAYLCVIDKAALDDPDDYHVAWRIWQEVWPRQRKLIATARDYCVTEAAKSFRGFVATVP